MSHVTYFTFYIYIYKGVELVGGRSVFNWWTPPSFLGIGDVIC